MRLFSDLSLKHKLMLLSLVTTTVALLLASGAFTIYEQAMFKSELVRDVESAADLLGYNSTAALSFYDRSSAAKTLQALNRKPNIIAACLYDENGAIFAVYPGGHDPKDFGTAPNGPAERFTSEYFELFRPISVLGGFVGTICLRADLAELDQRLRSFTLIGVGVAAITIAMACLLAARLQRMISGPVSELLAATARVGAEKDYSIRAVKRGEDELGRLIDGFNNMLGQIQERERALRAAHDSLEQRVVERTARLKETSALLEAMLENSPDLIYFKDRESRFVRFSDACLPRLHLTRPEELVGRTDADFFAPGHARAALADEQEIIRTGRPIIGKLEKETRSDGSITWVLTTKMPWRDAAGAIVGTFGISRDVTPLKETETTLAHERDQLRVLINSIPDTIYFKDPQSRFVLVSLSKVRKILQSVPDLRERRAAKGLPPDVPEPELLNGLTDFDTYQGDDAKIAFEDEQHILRTGQPLIGKLEKQSFHNGTSIWHLTSKMAWRDREGAIVGTFGISKDVTDLKTAEEKLEAMHRQLMDTSRQAGMAEIATGVLHNVGNVLNSVNVSATLVADQIRHSKVVNVGKLSALFMQNKTNLGEFIAQDARGKMIPEYLATLAEALAAEQKMLVTELENLRTNVEHIKEIVVMQQAYARPSGVVETVSLPDLVEDALRINAGSLSRHEVTTIRDYQARGVITTDKHMVIQILINLVRNAKYACDESGRTDKQIIVRTTPRDGGVEIAVSDNGVGIRPENLTRIFSHGFTTRKHGHGFGLHSGALAAKELGGELTVHSEGPGRGATFTLRLPRKSDSSDHETDAAG